MAYRGYGRPKEVATHDIPHCSDEQREAMLDVAMALKRQAEKLRFHQPLNNGRLEDFREALEMETFPEVARWAKSALGCDLFSSLREIEDMEEGLRSNDRTELVVQCCLAFEIVVNSQIESNLLIESGPSWLFDGARSLEEIAHLYFRLRFVKIANWLRVDVEEEMIAAVEDCIVASSAPWRGLLLILRAAPPQAKNLFFLFDSLLEMLEHEAAEIPRAALALFLSFASDAIHDARPYYRWLGKVLVERLLELGASPVVSTDAHQTLFKKLRQSHPGGWPAWLDETFSKTDPTERYPTALNRLLAYDWNVGFPQLLSPYVCCNMDAVVDSENALPPRVPSLQCLAAQKIHEAELEALPPVLKSIASKHVPISLDGFKIRPF